MLRLQVNPGELRHLAGAEDQDAAPLEVAEDLFRERDGRVADRDGAFTESRFGAHALADRERRVKQAVRQGRGELSVACDAVRGFDLAENLWLADHERIEPRGDPEQMARGIRAAMHVEVLRHLRMRDLVILAEEPPDAIGGRVRVADGIDLRAIAGREDDQLTPHAARRERGKRRLDASAREVDALPQLDGRRTVAQSYGEKAHGQKLWLVVRK